MSLVKPFYCEKCKAMMGHVWCHDDTWRCMECLDKHEVYEKPRWSMYDNGQDKCFDGSDA